jgi:hypothetical protein
MAKSIVKRTARALAEGNDETPFASPLGFSLPDRDKLQGRIDRFLADSDADRVPDWMRKDIERVLGAIYDGADIPGRLVYGSPEAVIIADGSRPVFFFENDRFVVKGAPDGPFVEAAVNAAAQLEQAALSVGRIETFDLPAPERIDVYYEGSCFLVRPDLVMTNRHVVQQMVRNPYSSSPPWRLRNEYWVNFDGQLNGPGRRFRIEAVEWMAPDPIGDDGDFARLDMALLRIGSPATAGLAKPVPLPITATNPGKDQKAALIGFPGSARVYMGGDPPPAGFELERVLFDVFDNRFGYKRCASGRISAPAGQHPRDTRKWAVAYDLSTLGGNSGSPVLLLGGGPSAVSALHFFGVARKANYGHVFDQLGAELGAYGIALI